MTALPTSRHRPSVPLAGILLVIQAVAGGVVPIAHASERFTAPANIEARHDAACLILHDDLRCALCHYAASRAQPQPGRPVALAAPRAESRIALFTGVRGPRPASVTPPPRAPPHHSR